MEITSVVLTLLLLPIWEMGCRWFAPTARVRPFQRALFWGGGILLLLLIQWFLRHAQTPVVANYAVIGAGLWLIAWVDLVTGEIPLPLTFGMTCGVIGWELSMFPPQTSLPALVLGLAIAAAGWLLGHYRPEAIGGADVILAGAAAIAAGLPGGIFVVSVWLLLIVVVHGIRQIGMPRFTPFVPLLALAWSVTPVALNFLLRA